jgi:hypothetical protein
MTPRTRLSALLGTAAGALVAAGCTTNVLGPADVASLRDSTALEAQVYADLADDAGVPKKVLRFEASKLYCSDRAVLRRSGGLLDGDGGAPIGCGAGK